MGSEKVETACEDNYLSLVTKENKEMSQQVRDHGWDVWG